MVGAKFEVDDTILNRSRFSCHKLFATGRLQDQIDLQRKASLIEQRNEPLAQLEMELRQLCGSGCRLLASSC